MKLNYALARPTVTFTIVSHGPHIIANVLFVCFCFCLLAMIFYSYTRELTDSYLFAKISNSSDKQKSDPKCFYLFSLLTFVFEFVPFTIIISNSHSSIVWIYLTILQLNTSCLLNWSLFYYVKKTTQWDKLFASIFIHFTSKRESSEWKL